VNHHPTVKPTDLMRYLVKLITPPGGTVLDPFTGSGSTGKGAVMEGFNFVGIELDPDYVAIANARIQHQLDKLLTDDATRRYLKADKSNDELF
jgi:site-specific DNA-methyltransferase (adenine-specific)